MSRRNSAGDLVPRDISEILAREGKAQRGQKKAGGSLGQAFSWLKGTKRKKNVSNEQNRIGSVIGATEGNGTKHGHQIQDSPKAGPKAQDEQRRLAVHYTASSQYQENVFVEGRRPQHIEDLHTEALQGLKILQQEAEHGNGGNFQDNHGNAGVQSEQDADSQDREGPEESRNSADNSSSASSRPVLTAQGSTFKPLNPVKRPEKAKKRIRRTTIMGIPQQIHRELALRRESAYEVPSPITNAPDIQSSDDQPDIVVIPTIDGETSRTNQDGARVHLSNLEACREEQLLRRHLQNVYREDQGFTPHRGLNSHLSPTQRPKSLAVPGMTSSAGTPSFLQEPQGPVMSISPQATYLSKIIPNAYLPASVEVIQISRSTSRGNNSNHSVSKSSVASGSSASPASSRTSGGDGCCDDGDCISHGGSSSHDDGSTATPHSVTSGSSLSHSQSSETMKSNSSALSSTKGSFGPANPQVVSLTGQERQPQQPDGGDKHLASLKTSKGSIIATGQGRSESGLSGSLSAGDTSDTGGDSHRFSRSLSIIKTKMPPAPPRRTNSLHHEKIMKRRPQELVPIRDLRHSMGREVNAGKDTGQVTIEISKDLYKQITKSSVPGSNTSEDTRSSTTSSPLSPMQASLGGSEAPERPESISTSPQKAQSEGGKFDRTMSPSSGYSSQSGTPTLSPKGICPSAPTGKQKKPTKPERSGSRASASSSLTSLSSVTSEHVNEDTSKNNPSPPQQVCPPLADMKSKTLAPGTQDKSPISMEIKKLLNIPAPPNVKAPSPPPPETWAHNRLTIELLCPPPSHSINSLAQLQEQQELKDTNLLELQQEAQNKDSKECQGLMAEQATIEEVVLTTLQSRDNSFKKIKPTSEQLPEIHKCLTKDQGRPVLIPEREEASAEVQKQSCSVAENQDQEVKHEKQGEISLAMIRKKEPPPVMKKRNPRPHRKDPEVQTAAASQQLVDSTTDVDSIRKSEMFFLQTEAEVVKKVAVVAKEVKVVTKQVEVEAKEVKVVTKQFEVEVVANEVEVVSKQLEVGVVAEEVEGQNAFENTTEECPTKPEPSMQTLGSLELPKVDKVSPPASPPPAHHPPPPPSKTPPSSVSTLLPEMNQGVIEEVQVVESNWPPPPPPEEPPDSVFDEPDEMAFPPPPPPFITDSLADKVESGDTVVDAQKTSTEALGVWEDKETLAGETGNVETAGLLPNLAPIDIKEDRPDVIVVYSNPDANSTDEIPSDNLTVVLSNEKDPEVNQLSSTPINMEEVTPESKETYPESQVLMPPPHKTPIPPITTAPGPTSNVPPPLSINIPSPPPEQFEDQTPSEPPVSSPSVSVPLPPPLPAENQPPVTFRRQPSFVNRETKARSKELLSRQKSAPIPKEDANIPLVTPSLLQMVRLRSVNVGEDQIKAPSDDNNNDEKMPAFYQNPNPTQTLGSQNTTPQKPVRKSLSLKSTPPPLKSSPATLVAPSMRLQEAIRMKTAAMSSRDSLPTRFRMPSSITFPSSCGGSESGTLSPASLEGGDMLKSPASTASFIFSKSSKKIVIETPVSSSEVQASLHQSLAEELKLVSDQSKTSTVANGNIGKAGIPKRVPPPVAKKPTHGITNPSERPVCSTVKSGNVPSPWRPEANGEIETVQPAGQQAQPEDHNTGSTMETSNIQEAPLPL
ncbi:LOW QUALITY PROTEIN: uncharacterized protein KIAA1522 homolog [Esox lucius]|uniref:LOW QUALITY PROTEIN: uncharacterized protein KIAA1522 homolog n=1 Tax=Esox lucius TaxID=8010 RepID=UPI0014778160|nr:LOW QUALITY PROTEIN: uncharacterized protein KIAA1522 homolog [Esox lucius]